MGKILAFTVALPITAAVAATAYLTHQNIQTYRTELATLLAEANASLSTQGLRIELDGVEERYFGMVREENYLLTEKQSGNRLMGFHQQVIIEPVRAYGTYGIDPEVGMAAVLLANAPGLIEGQEGYWEINGSSGIMDSHYQTGALRIIPADGELLTVSPLTITSSLDLRGERRNRTDIALASVSLSGATGEGVMISDVSLNVRSHSIQGQPFVDRVSYRIGDVMVTEADDSRVTFRGFETSQASLLEQDIYATLIAASLENLTLNLTAQDLSLTPSTLQLYVDGIHWPSLNAAGEQLQTGGDGSPAQLIQALSDIGAHGVSVALENVSSSFTLSDRQGAALNGDFQAAGFYRLAPGDAASLMQELDVRSEAGLSLNFSRSLLQTPQAGQKIYALLEAGYIQEDGERLICELQFKDGELTANQLPVTGVVSAE